jgi:hypothetical protein
LTNAKTSKPIWVGVQSYKKKDSRFPTPLEYRSQAYVALIHGAKGLMWYGGSVTGGILSAPEKKEDKEKEKPYTEQGHWEEMKKIVREVADLAPVIMAADEKPPSVSPANALISVRVKRLGDRVVLLAANRGNEKMAVDFESPLIRPGAVDVFNEKRTVTANAGRIADEFAPYAVHVYELAK